MKKQGNRFYTVIRSIVCFIAKIIYDPKIVNKKIIPIQGSVILAGNHRNNLDSIIVMCATKRQVHFLGKKELFDSPLKSIYTKMGVIPVDRKNKDIEARNRAIGVLKEDSVIGIFPEGTSNKVNNELLPFKFGAVSFSYKTSTPIIPFAIVGKYKFRSSTLKIIFGEPYMATSDLEESNDDLKSIISDLINQNI